MTDLESKQEQRIEITKQYKDEPEPEEETMTIAELRSWYKNRGEGEEWIDYTIQTLKNRGVVSDRFCVYRIINN